MTNEATLTTISSMSSSEIDNDSNRMVAFEKKSLGDDIVFCKVLDASVNQQSSLVCFTSLSSSHLTFAETRRILFQTMNMSKLSFKQWQFFLPTHGILSLKEESTLRLDQLISPTTIGTQSAPLILSIRWRCDDIDLEGNKSENMQQGYNTNKNSSTHRMVQDKNTTTGSENNILLSFPTTSLNIATTGE